MPVISYDVVATSLGRPLDTAEVAQVRQWIADAELLISVRLGPLDDLNPEVVAFVVREAVVARLRNPEGFQSETVDDYTYRFGGDTRRVTILDEWWQMLDPDAGGGAFSTRPGFEVDTARWSGNAELDGLSSGWCWR